MIRALEEADIADAVELSGAAGWNQTAGDWRMLLEMAPEGCFGIDCEGRLAATATLVTYGCRLAWLGMVLTWPAFRLRGFARTLVAHALEVADARAIETVKLDATTEGQPIYERLGFGAEQAVERWSGAGITDSGEGGQAMRELEALDRDAYGADRARMLCLLTAHGDAHMMEDGYLLTRAGRRATFLGPCVARTRETAEHLMRRGLAAHGGPWFWDLLPANANAVQLAEALGFRPERRLVRMYRGRELRGEERLIYATAGFELG